MSDAMSGKQALMRYVSLVAGPLLCLIIFLAMPSSYVTADGSVAEFSQAGRACLGMRWYGVNVLSIMMQSYGEYFALANICPLIK